MRSIYERALGADFRRLHPKIQERFGFSSAHGRMSIGRGVMDRMWTGPAWSRLFLRLGTVRHIMFPEARNGSRFTVENYAYRDCFGRETVTWIRTFELPLRTRRFDAYMIYSEARGKLVDYLGTHQHLAVDLEIRAHENGGVHFRSGEQRFYEHMLGFRVPAITTGCANVCEWFDNDAGCFRVRVSVENPRFGALFGYEGRFAVSQRECRGVPRNVLPLRPECRE